jgi:alpha/beta superfamily hydrolase
MSINLHELKSGENKLFLTAGSGTVEAILTMPDEQELMESPKAVALCCHPHPQFGGTMTNKVIHTVAKTFSRMGVPSLRFNFRGIGQSEGIYSDGLGESEDLLILSNLMKECWPQQQLWLSGFSFGSWIAARCAVIAGADQLLSIAPPVDYFDLDKVGMPSCPWLVVMGEKDEVVDPASVFNWIEAQSSPPKLVKYTETGHFFHGKMVQLSKTLQQHYQPILSSLI